jgi:hypothetical protein
MKNAGRPGKQQGAVAIIVGLTIFFLIGFLALVVDLGHVYVAKTELQNAADAAALAGAKELDGTRDGVFGAGRARDKAVEIAGWNNYDFSKPVTLTNANLSICSAPDSGCILIDSAGDADFPTHLFFQVDTGERGLSTWFARLMNIVELRTFGLAVAGRAKSKIAPLAICALELNDCPDAGTGNCGFIPGMGYDVRNINPLAPGTAYWIDPVAVPPGGGCDGSTSNTLPFACTGEVAIPVRRGMQVYTNTGLSTPQVEALNSRFDVYGNQAKCDPATAPPDTNLREFLANDVNGANSLFDLNPPPDQDTCTATTAGCSWQVPQPFLPPPSTANAQQVAHGLAGDYQCIGTTGHVRCDYTNALVWANSRPPTDPAFFVNPPAQGTAIAVVGWPPPNIKAPATTPVPPTGPYQQVYPATGTPSTATSGRFYQGPPTHTAVAGRRNMNLAIIDCEAGGGICRPATVLGVGSFYMTTKANTKVGITTQRTIYVEYNRMLSEGEIRGTDYLLFR